HPLLFLVAFEVDAAHLRHLRRGRRRFAGGLRAGTSLCRGPFLRVGRACQHPQHHYPGDPPLRHLTSPLALRGPAHHAQTARSYPMRGAPAAVRSAHMPATDHPRSIRSFVTRSGRITEAQQRALARLWPRYGIEFSSTRLDAFAVYGRDAPRTLEIGFCNGENLGALALAHPERDFLGV